LPARESLLSAKGARRFIFSLRAERQELVKRQNASAEGVIHFSVLIRAVSAF